MTPLTPAQQQKILAKTFTTIGHPKEDHADLMLMFYAGMANEFKDSENFEHLEEALENFMNSPEELTNAEELLDIWNVLDSHNLDQEITIAFHAYLNRYVNHLRSTLTEKQIEEVDEILEETAKLMEDKK